jgi:hypothetical protein
MSVRITFHGFIVISVIADTHSKMRWRPSRKLTSVVFTFALQSSGRSVVCSEELHVLQRIQAVLRPLRSVRESPASLLMRIHIGDNE